MTTQIIRYSCSNMIMNLFKWSLSLVRSSGTALKAWQIKTGQSLLHVLNVSYWTSLEQNFFRQFRAVLVDHCYKELFIFFLRQICIPLMHLFWSVMLSCDCNVIVIHRKQQINDLILFQTSLLPFSEYSKTFQSMERVRKSFLGKEEMQIPQSIHGAGGSASVTDGWN